MDVFIKILIGFLLLFTPFAFAGTEPWAFAVVQGVLLLAWGCVLFSRKTLYKTPLLKPICYTMGVLIFFGLLQAAFPQTLLDPISFFHPITLMRLYTLEHVSLFITYLAFALLVMQIYPSQREIRHLLEWTVICSLLVALVAVSFPKGEYIFRLTGIRGGIGPFLNRNHASLFFALNALAALGVFFTKGVESSRKIVSSKQKRNFIIQQICLASIFIALCVATIMTRSRGGMLSLFVGLFAYAFLYAYAVPHQLRKKLKSIFITLIVLLFSMGWIVHHTQDINAFAQRGTNASQQTRKMLYGSAFAILKDYPVWGVGIGAMPVIITSYTEWDVDSYIDRLHNDWLEILMGVGYLGAVFILLGLGWFCWRSLSLLKKLELRKKMMVIALLSILCAMSSGSLVDFHFFIPANALLFFMALGALAAPTYAAGHVYRVPLKGLMRLCILFVLLLALYIPTQKMLAWRLFVFGRGLKHQAKIAAYRQALKHYPSPRYAYRLAGSFWNASLYADSLSEQKALQKDAQNVIAEYLKKYPREKMLSKLYVRAQASMGKKR